MSKDSIKSDLVTMNTPLKENCNKYIMNKYRSDKRINKQCLILLLIASFIFILSNAVVSSVEIIKEPLEYLENIPSEQYESVVLQDSRSLHRRSVPEISGKGAFNKRPLKYRIRAHRARRLQSLPLKLSTLQKLHNQQENGASSARSLAQNINGDDQNKFVRRHGLASGRSGSSGRNLRPGVVEDVKDEEQGRSSVLGNMIEQLSTALHKSLVRNRTPKVEGREISRSGIASQARKVISSKVRFSCHHDWSLTMCSKII